MNILIIEARYHHHVVQMLLDGATAALEKGGAHFERVAVPGVLEIPPAIALAHQGAKPFDGYVALGCVLGGGLLSDTLFRETTRGLMALGLGGVALGQGIAAADDEQAALFLAREGDVGGEAARACLSLATLQERAGYLR
jgi:6,7-dimethyl-8-ribityllumazine synthase